MHSHDSFFQWRPKRPKICCSRCSFGGVWVAVPRLGSKWHPNPLKSANSYDFATQPIPTAQSNPELCSSIASTSVRFWQMTNPDF